ncbi:hypothetical protein [Tahibacter amnicola]|uniref:Tetratricopeptide repeat protein n=1 Tax=Tahibacter amnicola TaxID=2976241 RepID=A0ABY6BLV7_9GAMM|nr:hypothetical protein [Tahibacter amnicola]UXI69370.1 hypothetical protein N4264_06900 [Tahibacter amnicola]
MVGLYATVAGADYKDSYSRGLEAVKDGDWAEVRNRMQEALADNAEPAPRIRLYGQRWEPYVPQYFLGLAAFKLGDCKTAVAQWRSAANQGVIGKVAALKAAQDRDLSICETRLAGTDKPAPDKPVTPEPVQPVRPEPKPEPAQPEPVEPSRPEPEKPKPEPVRPEPRPDPPKPEPPKPAPTTPTVAQRVPDALLGAMRAFLAGRYAEVAQLAPDTWSDPKAKAHGFLLRAAARHMQAQLEGKDATDAVRNDIRAALAIDARLVPDATVFSPRFRLLFAATR